MTMNVPTHRYHRPGLRTIALISASLVVAVSTFGDANVGFAGERSETRLVLPTVDGSSVPLPLGASSQADRQRSDTSQPTVLCFLGTQCPLARVYGPRLQRLSDEYKDRGVRFIGINSNTQDSMDELREYGQRYGIGFPLAKDYDQKAAATLGVTRTPEVVIVDSHGRIQYQGRIDDQYQPGIARQQASQHDLKTALDELLAGGVVTRPRTQAVGCLIAFGKPREHATQLTEDGSDHTNLADTLSGSATEVTFCNQVIRVLQKHCIECHRSGEIGPFALDDYDEVVGWIDMSLEVIDQGRMPPWHADPAVGRFANARHMAESDKQLLHRWLDAGLPYGNPQDLPEAKTYPRGWRFASSPDAIIEMSQQPFVVPAEGTVEYQYFVVDPGFKEDKWIRGAQVIPGNPAVVHHCIVFTRPPDGHPIDDIGFLSAYVPGQVRGDLPPGYAQHVPAGSKLVFQMHYTPTGRIETDLTRLGLVFCRPEEVTHKVYVVGGIQQDFEIPPHAARYEVRGTVSGFPRNGTLLAITPHMHLRGRAFEFELERSGHRELLLRVPNYDFNWQHNYELVDPIPLADVDRMRFTAVFDNSDSNPTNPDPTEYVTWGDQTWQEMAVTFVTVARPLEDAGHESRDDTGAALANDSRDDDAIYKALQAEWKQESRRFAEEYLKRFDKNHDGGITAYELPDAVRMFSFWNFDHDGDERISRDEIEDESYWRLQRSHSRRHLDRFAP